MEKELVEVVHLLTHMKHPEIYSGFGILPPRGFLVHGPPGCGKTMLVSAIAGQLQIPLLKVSAPEIVAGVSSTNMHLKFIQCDGRAIEAKCGIQIRAAALAQGRLLVLRIHTRCLLTRGGLQHES